MRSALACLALASCFVAGCLDPDEDGNLVPLTADQDPSLPSIELAGTTLHAETFGEPSDPMIMVLHGGPGADYRSLLPLRALADDGYFVVFWDQRGAGLSRRHDPGIYSFHRYLEDLRLVVEHYTDRPDQPLVFIGHSWGAMYATWFINEYGDYGGRLRGAVLSEPGAFTSDQLERYAERLFGSIEVGQEPAGNVFWSSQLMSPKEHARADYLGTMESVRGLPAVHIDPDNPAPMWRVGAVVRDALLALADGQGFDWTTDLDAFEPLVLFLRGELNEAMPLAHQQALASSYPMADIVTIPDVGHEMVWERPQEYLGHVRDYLGDIGFGEVGR